MSVLVLAEHSNTTLDESTARAVTAALCLGSDVHILVAGQNCQGATDAAASLEGVSKVLRADDAGLANQLPEPLAGLILALSGSYDAFVAASTTTGKDVMPRVAALLDVMQISDVIAVEGPDLFRRPIYAGNIIQTVRSKDGKKVLTVRASAFAPVARGESKPIEDIQAAAAPTLSSFVSNALAASERPELTSARIVVSGGRGSRLGGQFRDSSGAACRRAGSSAWRQPSRG